MPKTTNINYFYYWVSFFYKIWIFDYDLEEFWIYLTNWGPNVRLCREMSTGMCCIHLGCFAEMIFLVVFVKFGNCYVHVRLSDVDKTYINISDGQKFEELLFWRYLTNWGSNVQRCRKMSTGMCCIHLGCLAEMISLVVLVKFGNCYVRVLMSTCRQIDALENRKTDHTSVIIWHSSSL